MTFALQYLEYHWHLVREGVGCCLDMMLYCHFQYTDIRSRVINWYGHHNQAP